MQDVDSALEILRARDATAARLAGAMWQASRIGAAHDLVTRYDVQGVVWSSLPQLVRRPEVDDAFADVRLVCAAYAELLDLVGYHDYAALCRSRTTSDILDAAPDPDRCAELVDRAWQRSGLRPPDTPLVTWLPERGRVEQALHAGLGRLLEESITSGWIDPATREGRARSIAMVNQLLASPADDQPGTWFARLFQERHDSWKIAGGSALRRELLVRVSPEVASPPDPEPCAELPALWALIAACRSGVRLTPSGYLPTELVAELIELLPACAEFETSGRSESHWPPLLAMRKLAQELDLVRREGNTLVTSRAAGRFIEDHDSLLKWVGEHLMAGDLPHIGYVMQETLLAVLLLEDHTAPERLFHKMATVVDEEGWRLPDGAPPSRAVAEEVGWQFIRRLHVLDVIDADPVDQEVGFTLAGLSVARWALRSRVMHREPA